MEVRVIGESDDEAMGSRFWQGPPIMEKSVGDDVLSIHNILARRVIHAHEHAKGRKEKAVSAGVKKNNIQLVLRWREQGQHCNLLIDFLSDPVFAFQLRPPSRARQSSAILPQRNQLAVNQLYLESQPLA